MGTKKKYFIRDIKFSSNNVAVIDLPMKLVISLMIGSIVLASIISLMSSFPFPPSTLHVSIYPTSCIINESKNASTFNVLVQDSMNHKPIHNGLVTIQGDDIISYNMTNASGECIVHVSFKDCDLVTDTFLDVQVKVPGYDRYRNENMIRIVFT